MIATLTVLCLCLGMALCWAMISRAKWKADFEFQLERAEDWKEWWRRKKDAAESDLANAHKLNEALCGDLRLAESQRGAACRQRDEHIAEVKRLGEQLALAAKQVEGWKEAVDIGVNKIADLEAQLGHANARNGRQRETILAQDNKISDLFREASEVRCSIRSIIDK